MPNGKRKFLKKEGIGGSVLSYGHIVGDSQTSVNYISTGYAITPLLDKDGKPVIDSIDSNQ